MKRLTYPGDYCKDIAYCNNGCTTANCRNKQLWEKLKAYEDTGLTPEEVRALIEAKERIKASPFG